MKTLIIVRHGSFDHTDPQIADVDRPLNRKGRSQVSKIAARFSSLQIKPDLLVSSPAKRAMETAEIFAGKAGVSSDAIQVEEDVFEAERSEILRVVHRLDDAAQTVILVGHHPGVTELLQHLVDSDVEKIGVSSVAVVELSAESWQTVSFKQGQLIEYIEPKQKEQRHGLWWRFTFWRRQQVHKVELFIVFLIGLLVILGLIGLIVRSSFDSAGMPDQGSGGIIREVTIDP